MSETGRASWGTIEGTPFPQGVTWIPGEDAYNFALYSKHAERVLLLLYSDNDVSRPVLTRPLEHPRHKTGRIWHVRITRNEASTARYYAYQVDGPTATTAEPWHRFDRDKVLFDPYARGLYFPPAFDPAAATRPGSNAGHAPLGILPGPVAAPQARARAPRHESDAVIYELHVRGFTRCSEDVPAGERGTFQGLVRKIPYLVDLGVTIVELMPVFQYDPTNGDYWGYMPLSFFALHAPYARSGGGAAAIQEFRELVDALHAAGMEVLLDVVYNHTGELGERGPTYSLRGIDNSTYYLMSRDPARPYRDLSGTGNTIHAGNRYVRKMIVDSLRYWAEEIGVDGFRFDLASVFARDAEGRLLAADSGLFGDVVTDPVLSRLRLIAEPWDAAGAHLLGRSLPGITWAQWNGRFQQDVRRFVRGDHGVVGDLMTRIYGSDDLFPDDRPHAYRPWQSINFVTSHDGFTLYDLISYERKRNEANGHENLDGTDHNLSWNCGWEGDENVPPDVHALRLRQARNFLAILLLSNGTPMIRAGDEFLQTQRGNNNPYNQDNATSWLDWRQVEENGSFHRFARLMIAFRKTHPSLSRSRFWRDDVDWYGADGPPETGVDSVCLAFCIHCREEDDTDLYVMINGGNADRTFTIQEDAPELWGRAVDTALPSPEDIVEPGTEERLESAAYLVSARSVVVLVRSG